MRKSRNKKKIKNSPTPVGNGFGKYIETDGNEIRCYRKAK